MQVQFIFILFFFLLLFILCFGLLPFVFMVNRFYFHKSRRSVFYFVVGFNSVFILFFVVSKVVQLDFFTNLSRFLNYYLGFLLYGFLISLVFWVVFFVMKGLALERFVLNKQVLVVLLLVFFVVNFVAIYNFNKPIAVEEHIIYSNKITRNYTFVHISDIQYGTVGRDYMEKAMRLSYEQNPDFIVFTGDLIDFENYEFEDFEVFEESSVPIYFERGNHEFYHDPQRILAYLSLRAQVRLLLNEKDEFEELDIVGIDHNMSKYQLRDELEKIELDESRFSILLYHEPRGVEFAALKGFDLALFAHTHAGQIWPITELVDVIYEYGDGYFVENDTIIYTTDGAALWGPRMRLDSQNEIVVFNLVVR